MNLINIAELKPGDILIDKKDSSNLLVVKDKTKNSLIATPVATNFKTISQKDSVLPLPSVPHQFIQYIEPMLIDRPLSIKPSDLKVGLKIIPIEKSVNHTEARVVTYVGDDFYLYTDRANRETKESFQSLSSFCQVNESIVQTNPLTERLGSVVSEYNNEQKNLRDSLKKVIKHFDGIKEIRNLDIKSKLQNSMLQDLFSHFTSFCLMNDIPLSLTDTQINHLKFNGVGVKVVDSKEVRGLFSLSDEKSYISLYQVSYFTDESLKDAINQIISEELFSNSRI